MFIVIILGGPRERLVICGSVCPVGVAIVLFVVVAACRPLEAQTKGGPPWLLCDLQGFRLVEACWAAWWTCAFVVVWG